ncbi:MAG: translation elongation factor-like protein [Candidatus Omnitrophica bacterium]|nr:translation elongation factor-like protein [Candidatus Omnitrophota bacterium]
MTHFFPHVSAGVIKLSKELKVGDMIRLKGHTTDFKQPIDSMQIEHVPVTEAKKGAEIGIKVKDRVRIGDLVYKL